MQSQTDFSSSVPLHTWIYSSLWSSEILTLFSRTLHSHRTYCSLIFLCLEGLGRVSLSFRSFFYAFFFFPESVMHTQKVTNNDPFSLNYFLYKIPTFLKWRFLVTILLYHLFSLMIVSSVKLPNAMALVFVVCGGVFVSQKCVPLVYFSSGCVRYLLWWSVQLLSFSFSQNCLWLLAP